MQCRASLSAPWLLRDRAVSASSKIVGFTAVTLAAVNIFGGFIVTQRMLQMFKKRQRQENRP